MQIRRNSIFATVIALSASAVFGDELSFQFGLRGTEFSTQWHQATQLGSPSQQRGFGQWRETDDAPIALRFGPSFRQPRTPNNLLGGVVVGAGPAPEPSPLNERFDSLANRFHRAATRSTIELPIDAFGSRGFNGAGSRRGVVYPPMVPKLIDDPAGERPHFVPFHGPDPRWMEKGGSATPKPEKVTPKDIANERNKNIKEILDYDKELEEKWKQLNPPPRKK